MSSPRFTGRGKVPRLGKDLTAKRRRWWLVLTGAGVVFGMIWTLGSASYLNGYDVLAYWTVDVADPYRTHIAPAPMAFLYSPPFAYVFDPLGLMPWGFVRVAWSGAQAFALALLAGPLTLPLAVIGPVHDDLLTGNIGLFMALAIWAGIRRWPEAWAFPILAKVTPVVGLAWYIGRSDMRGLTRACAMVALVAAVTFVAEPGLWIQWMGVLRDNAAVSAELDLGPLWLRLPLAAMACWWAGRTDRPWLVPIAVALSLGHPWISSLSVATAAIPLWYSSRRSREVQSLQHGEDESAPDVQSGPAVGTEALGAAGE